jgi:DNA-directed RNA polymerase specialized sigma24 family protein
MSRSQLQPPIPTEGLAADAEHAVRLRSLAERRRALEDELGRAVVDAVTAGMSQAAVSRVLGVSRQAVWDRLHRA